MLFDQEKIYQMLHKKDWIKVCENMFRTSKDLEHKDLVNDPMVQQVVHVFETEFFSHTDNLSSKERLHIFKSSVFLLESEKKLFSKKFNLKLVENYLELLYETQDKGLMSYISTHSQHPLAKKLLKKINKDKPEVIANARQEKTSIKSTPVISGEPKTISLFKSPQEQYFFDAMRNCFHTYLPYPNVAMSSILDYKKIESFLTQQEKDFFLKSVIDCVVFDPAKKYLPIHFFELDSSFHDNIKSKMNDKMKKNIFKKANVKLVSIRLDDPSKASVEHFQEIIYDLVRY
jgi:hypothetical protein